MMLKLLSLTERIFIMNDLVLSDSFADYFVILLISRCRAIFTVELLSASASTIIQYSSANASLVETCKRDVSQPDKSDGKHP